MNNHHKPNYHLGNENQSSSDASTGFQPVSFTSTETGMEASHASLFHSIWTTGAFNTTDPGHVVRDIDVTKSDVLSERGKGVLAREGNEFYSRMIKHHREEYQNEKTIISKRKIVEKVLDIIKLQDPPGRFMKRTRGNEKRGGG